MIGEKYRVIRKIGAGSFGTIYLCEHIITQKKVAIKTEPVNASFPLIIYEANVTLLLHGLSQSVVQNAKRIDNIQKE